MKNKLQKYDNYKHSNEDWIAEIPEHWEVKKLKLIFTEKKNKNNPKLNCGSISFGKVVIKDDEKIPLSTKASYQEVLNGEFLINPLNLNYDLISLRIALSYIDVVVSSGYIVLNNIIEINKEYFKYLLHRYDVAYMKLLGSGVRQTINFNHIANSLLIFPPLSEQEKIAQFLDDKTTKIDKAIEIKERQIELLKERRQILIHRAVTRGLDTNVPLKDSGVEWIGEIPEHWSICSFSYISKIDTGSTPDRTRPNYWNGSIPWVKTGEVNYNTITDTEEKITNVGLKNSSTRLAPVGTILMAMYGQGVTRGRVAILGVSAAYNQACCAIQFNHRIINIFGYYFLIAAYPNVRDAGNESSQMNLSSGYISKLKIPIPPIEEQKAIVSHIENISAKISKAIGLKEREIEVLKEYKSSLINSAVTGKVKIG